MLFYPKKSQTWLRRQKNGIIKKKKNLVTCIGTCLGLNRKQETQNYAW